MKIKPCLLLFILATTIACKNTHHAKTSHIEEVADSFATNYFNAMYQQAARFTTPESEPYLHFAASQIGQEDIDVLNQQEEHATIEIKNVEYEDGDTTATVSLNVMNYLCMDTIGKPGHIVENGDFKITLVYTNKQWRVRMEGLPQNEKTNHD